MIVSGDILSNISNLNSSEGQRIVIWKHIILNTISNPIFGNNFLGYWTIPDSITGSSHNQLFDVMLRTGIVGFSFYLILLFKLSKFLYQKHFDLFIGFIGVLTYGMFHETFKESNGAFLFAFIIGIFANRLHKNEPNFSYSYKQINKN